MKLDVDAWKTNTLNCVIFMNVRDRVDEMQISRGQSVEIPTYTFPML